MVDRSFLLINFRSICSLIYERTFWDTLYIRAVRVEHFFGSGNFNFLRSDARMPSATRTSPCTGTSSDI